MNATKNKTKAPLRPIPNLLITTTTGGTPPRRSIGYNVIAAVLFTVCCWCCCCPCMSLRSHAAVTCKKSIPSYEKKTPFVCQNPLHNMCISYRFNSRSNTSSQKLPPQERIMLLINDAWRWRPRSLSMVYTSRPSLTEEKTPLSPPFKSTPFLPQKKRRQKTSISIPSSLRLFSSSRT